MNADVVDAELVRLRAEVARYRRKFYAQRTRAAMWQRRAIGTAAAERMNAKTAAMRRA